MNQGLVDNEMKSSFAGIFEVDFNVVENGPTALMPDAFGRIENEIFAIRMPPRSILSTGGPDLCVSGLIFAVFIAPVGGCSGGLTSPRRISGVHAHGNAGDEGSHAHSEEHRSDDVE